MPAYKKEQFAECSFNPFDPNLDQYPKLIELFPEASDLVMEDVDVYLGELEDKPEPKEFFGQRLTERLPVLKYIITLYDPKSPLIRDYPALPARQKEAMLLSDIPSEFQEEIMIHENFLVVWVIHRYLEKIAKSRMFAMIGANEYVFWEYTRRMMQPTLLGDKDKDLIQAVSMKSKMGEDLQIINNRLDMLYKEFYSDDGKLVDAAIKIKKSSPEGWAKQVNV